MIVLPFLLDDFFVNEIAAVLVWAVAGVGLMLLVGYTGLVSLGHAAFLGAGSYATVWMFKLLNYNILPGMVLAVVVAGLFSLLIGFICLRRSGIYFSILHLPLRKCVLRSRIPTFSATCGTAR